MAATDKGKEVIMAQRNHSRKDCDAYFEEDRHRRQAHAEEPTRRGYPSGGGGHKGKKTKRRTPRWKKITATVLVFLLLMVGVLAGLLWFKLNGINRIGGEDRIDASDEDFERDSDTLLDTMKDSDMDFSTANVLKDQDVVNVLLIGRDTRDEKKERGRSDSMIVLSLNRATKQISMVSLMRDSYVQIPGYSNNKLNAAFAFGGYDLLDETIAKNYGIHIDYNVGVNFEGFERVIDQLGGIEVDLTKAEAKYLMNDIYIHAGNLKEGTNLLTGETALCYARARYVSTGTESNDFGRTARQRVVLTKVYEKMMKKPLPEIWKLMDSVMDCIETDMTNMDIVSLGTEFYNMGIGNLESYRLPMDGEFSDEKVNGMSVLALNWDKARNHLQEWLYPAH